MLSQFLLSEVFSFMLIFCRMGSAMMLLPGFAESYIGTRMRLLLALFFSLVLTPVIHTLPPIPSSFSQLLYIASAEILIGLFMGGLSRMLIAAIHTGASIIAYQASLTSALTQNIAEFQGQDTTVGNLLSMTAVVLLFATDLHHIMLKGLAQSYTLFLPGQFPAMEDLAMHATHIMSSTFQMAMQIAAPNIAIGLMLYLGAGILSRLMPNMQIFFIMTAPQLLLSFSIIMISISFIMLWYMEYFKDQLALFMLP